MVYLFLFCAVVKGNGSSTLVDYSFFCAHSWGYEKCGQNDMKSKVGKNSLNELCEE